MGVSHKLRGVHVGVIHTNTHLVVCKLHLQTLNFDRNLPPYCHVTHTHTHIQTHTQWPPQNLLSRHSSQTLLQTTMGPMVRAVQHTHTHRHMNIHLTIGESIIVLTFSHSYIIHTSRNVCIVCPLCVQSYSPWISIRYH